MEIGSTTGERCPNCFTPPLTGWRRVTFSLNPARYEIRECEFCGTALRIRHSEPVRKIGKFVAPLLFFVWIAFDAFDLPVYWVIVTGAGAALVFAVAISRLELIVERADIPDSPSMERVREMDEDLS